MGGLYVYEPWPTSVEGLGLCGPLTPTSARYAAAKNGEMELVIHHPIDPAGKWSCLTDGRLIAADVPMRTTPIINSSGYATTLERWTVKAGAARADRGVVTAIPSVSGVEYPIRLATLEPGTSVFVVRTLLAWSEVVWTYGRGWIRTASIEYAQTFTSPNPLGSDKREGTEKVIPSPHARPQLFRIYGVRLSDGGLEIRARHVSYDILGALITYNATPVDCGIALSNIMLDAWWGKVARHVDIDWWSNVHGEADISGWTRVSQIEALLAPSNSVAAYWNAFVLRDNWTYTILKDADISAGYAIEYGANMLGVEFDVDTTQVEAGLIPVGQTSKGKPLTVADGTYTVDGRSVTVSRGVVQSPNDAYPVPHVGVLDLGSSIRAAGTGAAALNAAYVKLIRAALKKFADEGCDQPPVNLRVEFMRLGDTAEFSQYRNLEKLFLYDLVRVRHPRLGIDVTAEVNRIDWDCLRDRYASIELGSIRRDSAGSRFAPWQIPGLSSLGASVTTLTDLV